MQATTAQAIQNERAVATGLLAGIFTAGLALGAITGIAMAPKVAPLANTQAAKDVYAGPYLGRGGLRAPVAIRARDFSRSAPLQLHRQGEINVGSGPEVTPKEFRQFPSGPTVRTTPTGTEYTTTGPRYEVVRGK